MNRLKTRTTRAGFRIIRASGKVEQHILIFDPAELPSLKVNVFVELHPGDRLEQARPKHPRGMCSESREAKQRSANPQDYI
jgi:hypothetical protein